MQGQYRELLKQAYKSGNIDLLIYQMQAMLREEGFRKYVYEAYVDKIIKENQHPTNPDYPKTSLRYDNSEAKVINSKFNGLDYAIIITNIKHDKNQALKSTYNFLSNPTKENLATISQEGRNTIIQYVRAVQSVHTSNWQQAIFTQIANDVALELKNELDKEKQIENQQKINALKTYPENIRKIRSGITLKEASERDNINYRHVSGNINGMYYAQDIGNRKSVQQDALVVMEHPTIKGLKLAVVCDGVSRSANSERASHYAVNLFSEWFGNFDPEDPDHIANEQLNEEIKDICYTISKKINDNPETYKGYTTVAGVILGNKDGVAFNVGDSRVYELRDNKLKQITTDDSTAHVNYVLEYTKFFSEEYMRFFKNGHAILRYLGSDDKATCNPKIIRLSDVKKATYIVCSDGVSNCMSNDEIIFTLKQNNVANLADLLVNQALINPSYVPEQVKDALGDEAEDVIEGGFDNTSAIVIKGEPDNNDNKLKKIYNFLKGERDNHGK